MKKYNVIIIEDEKNIREALSSMIVQNCPQLTIVGSVGSASEGRGILSRKQVDFIFLDIAMPKEDGFEFLSSIQSEKYGLIFTTAYQEFALKALKANAIDYLLKPIEPIELREAVKKAIYFHELRQRDFENNKVYLDSMNNFRDQFSGRAVVITKITVADQFGFKIIDINNLMYLIADSNYTHLYLSGGQKITATRNLGEFEKIINSPRFFRIHKSTLVNVDHVLGYSSYEGSFAEMKDGTHWIISRRKTLEFRSWIKKFTVSIE